jgi:hypothetical protein
MAIVLIGSKETTEIAAAIERARAHPVPLSLVRAGAVEDKPVIKLADRKPGYERPRPPEEVLIPIGYRANVSVEEQPSGLFLHLSISVERADPKLMPSVAATTMIADAFGVDYRTTLRQGLIWMEEYDPGRYAINLMKLIVSRQEGHA